MPGFCMQLTKAYVAKTYCNELLLILLYMLITLFQQRKCRSFNGSDRIMDYVLDNRMCSIQDC